MGSNISCRQKPSEEISSAAAEVIGGNEDLLIEIFLRLPAKSVIPLKLVSKTWLSLISSHHFSLLWHRYRRNKISGIFFNSGLKTEIKYIPLIEYNSNSNGGESKSSLVVVPNMQTRILHSCNGFLLCVDSLSGNYQVYNPTTKQFSFLPKPSFHSTGDNSLFSCANIVDRLLYLSFDPLKSLHYKVVLLHEIVHRLYEIHIYSSETRAWWTPFDDSNPFSAPVVLNINNGVYCNGSIHWFSLSSKATSMYFDVDQHRFCPMPSPLYEAPYNCRHFGESRGHLHLTEHTNYGCFNISQMESDYSKWSLKYRVELDAMDDFVSHQKIWPNVVYVLSLIHGEDGDVFLVRFLGSNIIFSYNIKDNTIKKLNDEGFGDEFFLFNGHVHSCIETLYAV
ncbi:F-box protein At5g07610-like [Cornus florida]|uniref:F-box protein At5g07610-like n=1 Tax=Cornus florida TaxID=4283 RepID=UPI0028A2D456|nr:F-box protein At5g07610-like [Cornus florida]